MSKIIWLHVVVMTNGTVSNSHTDIWIPKTLKQTLVYVYTDWAGNSSNVLFQGYNWHFTRCSCYNQQQRNAMWNVSSAFIIHENENHSSNPIGV